MMSPNERFWISRYVKNKIVHISKMQAVNIKAKKEGKQNVSNSIFFSFYFFNFILFLNFTILY